MNTLLARVVNIFVLSDDSSILFVFALSVSSAGLVAAEIRKI